MLPRETLFISEYLKDFNGVRAAQAAGYGNDYNSAGVYAHQLLKKPKICAEIYRHVQDKVQRNQLMTDRIVQELVAIAYAVPERFMDEDGEYLPWCEIDDELKPAVQDYKVVNVKQEDGSLKPTYRYKFMDRTKALDMLAKHAAMFTEKVEMNHTVTDFDRLMEQINGKTRAL